MKNKSPQQIKDEYSTLNERILNDLAAIKKLMSEKYYDVAAKGNIDGFCITSKGQEICMYGCWEAYVDDLKNGVA